MEKTYKEIRQDLAAKYHDRLREMEGTLDFLAKSGSSKEEIRAIRERLISNLQNELANEDGYEESRRLHRAEAKKELYGNKEKILENLKNNCVKVEENVEYMGYKGKKVHINLPEVKGKFDGFKFDYFVSDGYVTERDFEKKPELQKKSYSQSDVAKLLQAINKYISELQLDNDGNIDYENDLDFWKDNNKCICNAGHCLKEIAGLVGYSYWLKDKNVDGVKNSRSNRNCIAIFCAFNYGDRDTISKNLLLRLS